MRTIIVDDEALMLRKFRRISSGIADIELTGEYEDGRSALEAAKDSPPELAFLDIDMPGMNGIELAKKLRAIREDMLIVFLTAHDQYIREANDIGGDYYLLKPYSEKTLQIAMERLRLISRRQERELYIQMFGRFLIMKGSTPVAIEGKAKEILALVTAGRGKEISNKEIYRVIWEDRPYNNRNMTVFYNAMRRLRRTLAREGIQELLISTSHGQKINTEMFDCDYYAWQDRKEDPRSLFEGEFLSEYPWSESYLAEIMEKYELGIRW